MSTSKFKVGDPVKAIGFVDCFEKTQPERTGLKVTAVTLITGTIPDYYRITATDPSGLGLVDAAERFFDFDFQPSKEQLAVTSDGTTEFYVKAGEVFRAPLSAPIMSDGFRCGRWECSTAHFERFRSVVVW